MNGVNLLEKFKSDLMDSSQTDEDIVGKYLLTGVPVDLNDELFYELRKEIGSFFNVSITRVHVVGSAKLGFSIAPNKRFRKINDDSDIDVAVIDEYVFDDYWRRLFDFNSALTSKSDKDELLLKQFESYFFRGWIRPDKFPLSYQGKNEWFEFFKSISYKKYNKRKITAAIYKNEHFFENYHLENIHSLRSEMQNEYIGQNGNS